MASGRQELRAWRSECAVDNGRLGTTSSANVPVSGSDVPFEELVTRELRKSQGNGSKSIVITGDKTSKRPFLKKRARGWWMRRSGAKEKVVKHILTSSDEIKPMSMIKKRPQHREEKSLAVLLPKSRSSAPEHVRTVVNASHTLSPPVSPIRQTHYNYQDGEKVQLPMTQNFNFEAWKSASLRSTTSTDIMGMQNLRQSYEANQEREASDMAEFEAIERDLAAEKEAFWMEKQNKQPERSVEHREQIYHDSPSDANRWGLPYSSFVSDLHEQEELRRQTTRRDSSFDGSLDGETDLALMFDEYSALSKDDEMSEQDGFVCQLQDHFGYGSRYSDPPSDVSAVSYDDSVPWDDDLSLQPRQNDAHEQSLNIAAAGLLVSPNKQDCVTSEGARHQATKREVYFADRGGNKHNVLGHNKSGTPDFIAESNAPISSSVQHMFEEFEQDENSDSVSPSYEDDMNSVGDSTSINTAWSDPSPPPPPPVQDRSLSNLKPKLRDEQKPPVARSSTSKAKGDVERARQANGKTAALSHVPGTGSSNDTRPHSRDQLAQPANAGTILPAVIEEKLNELEDEVKLYKSETLQLQKRKNYYDQEVKNLILERDEFQRFQQKQRLLIEKEWERERIKMKKEAKRQERQWKLGMNTVFPHQDRKDCGELELTKAQIDVKAGASERKAENDNFRQRVFELEEKIRELTDEIRFLEKDRLQQWKHFERLLETSGLTSKSEVVSSVTSALSEKNEICVMNDLDAIERTPDKLLQKWNDPHKRSPRIHENDITARSAYQDCVQSDAADSYNPKQCSFNQENSHSLSEVGRGGNELDRPSVKDMNIASDADHALASNTAATYVWALPAAEDAEVVPTIGYADQESKNCKEDDANSTSSLSEHKVMTQAIEHMGGKKELLYMDGSRKILFPDGNEKNIDAHGHAVIKFTNGDRKEVFPDTGVSVYYYYEARTKLTTYPDNRKVYEFPNHQIETSLPDGTTKIEFPDGIKKTIRPNGDELSMFPDGTTMLEQPSGLREVTLLNQKKVRYYPEGQIACVSLSGQESWIQSDSELKQLMEST